MAEGPKKPDSGGPTVYFGGGPEAVDPPQIFVQVSGHDQRPRLVLQPPAADAPPSAQAAWKSKRQVRARVNVWSETHRKPWPNPDTLISFTHHLVLTLNQSHTLTQALASDPNPRPHTHLTTNIHPSPDPNPIHHHE